MAMREIEPYIFDPDSESESEIEVHKESTRQHGADRGIYWVQNGDEFSPQYRTISSTSHRPGSIEPDQTEQNMSEPEAPAQSYEDEDDVSEEEEEGDKGNQSSDEDWLPQTLTEEGNEDMTRDTSSEDDSSEEAELDEDQKPTREPKKKQLCTECGAFYCTQKHVCEHKTKPYVCNVCGKRCVTQLSLKLHSNIHSETYEHYCKYCYATFKTKLDKLAHEEIHQNQPRPYKCPDCTVTFAKNTERRKHMKKHKGPDEFKCDICGLAIGKKHKLRHMMIHTGAKPFKCPTCDRTFNQSGNLKSHMRVHTGEQPYKCQYCDKSFNHNVSLKSHLQRYHPLESGEKDTDSKSSDGVADSVQNQDTEQMQQVKVKISAAGRPLGRPKKAPTSHGESSWLRCEQNDTGFKGFDESQDFRDDDGPSTDFQKGKQEQTVTKIKPKSTSDSDSDYDPEKEAFSSGKQRGRSRKI
ncbi:zinc finger protein 184-like isoform X2 [Boleophthalmus pectinirostris]|uniref:zinc finger protein 184-like isoform X2 n=1 Tax=Boleophthalmus pectinirostris TaxID=150288 RepID=UPI00243159CE|nr:zinc finger protein 184-like isoform X2 [Boleophthalmus pectinirostris]